MEQKMERALGVIDKAGRNVLPPPTRASAAAGAAICRPLTCDDTWLSTPTIVAVPCREPHAAPGARVGLDE